MEPIMRDDDASGEARERAQRRKFWAVLGIITLVGMTVGAVLGYQFAHHDFDPDAALSAIPPWLIVSAALLYVLSVSWGTWRFVKVIDEVELQDNLWGSTAGFYFYGLAFPLWWGLWTAGLVPEPNDWAMFIATVVAGMLVYGMRKANLR
jgi:uncharacterized membrane protein YfcA